MNWPALMAAAIGTWACLAPSPSHAAHRPPVQVFIAGDSTAAEYGPERYPQLGWGMVLPCAFDRDVTVRNIAKGGRSTKSFISQGFFGRIERDIRAGDVLLIQFGHNDAKSDDPVRATDSQLRGPGLVGVRGSAGVTWDNLMADLLVPLARVV